MENKAFDWTAAAAPYTEFNYKVKNYLPQSNHYCRVAIGMSKAYGRNFYKFRWVKHDRSLHFRLFF